MGVAEAPHNLRMRKRVLAANMRPQRGREARARRGLSPFPELLPLFPRLRNHAARRRNSRPVAATVAFSSGT